MSYTSRDIPTEREIIGALLKGGCYLFGKRVELAWPDGLPDGMTQADLEAMGKTMTPQPAVQWSIFNDPA